MSSGPRKSTKLTKPLTACSRIEGVIVVIYINDVIVIGETYEERLIGTIKTIKLLLKLGFTTFNLGLVFNSKEMLVTLTSEKSEKNS